MSNSNISCKNNIYNSITLNLPDYVNSLANNFTIQATSIYSPNTESKIYETSEVENNCFEVFGPNGSFYWIVHGERGPVIVEPRKSQVQIAGDGPYKYISKIN